MHHSNKLACMFTIGSIQPIASPVSVPSSVTISQPSNAITQEHATIEHTPNRDNSTHTQSYGGQSNSYCNVDSATTTSPYSIPQYSSDCLLSTPPSSEEEEDIMHISKRKKTCTSQELSDTPGPPPMPLPPQTKMDVQVYYGSIHVFARTITVIKGFRIFFDPRIVPPAVEGSQMPFQSTGIEQIQLPNCHPNPYANEIFNAMSEGLIIEMVDDNIYATPLCRPVVYTGRYPSIQSNPLGKGSRTKVFDYANYFRPSLERYIPSIGSLPSAHTLFSLGQPWGPSSPAKNIFQVLVSIHVIHSKACGELPSLVSIP